MKSLMDQRQLKEGKERNSREKERYLPRKKEGGSFGEKGGGAGGRLVPRRSEMVANMSYMNLE